MEGQGGANRSILRYEVIAPMQKSSEFRIPGMNCMAIDCRAMPIQ